RSWDDEAREHRPGGYAADRPTTHHEQAWSATFRACPVGLLSAMGERQRPDQTSRRGGYMEQRCCHPGWQLRLACGLSGSPVELPDRVDGVRGRRRMRG